MKGLELNLMTSATYTRTAPEEQIAVAHPLDTEANQQRHRNELAGAAGKPS